MIIYITLHTLHLTPNIVLNPRAACEIAMKARREGRSATKDIVKWAIDEMPNVGVRDNITVIAIFLNETTTAI